MVYSTIGPILAGFRRNTGRSIRLEREKEVISTDNEVGEMEEFVVLDYITVTEEKFVLIIEAEGISRTEYEAVLLVTERCGRQR